MNINNHILASSTPIKSRIRHPRTQVMVDEALSNNGKKCSYRAIKNYISTTYNVNMSLLSHYIKSYIRSSVENGKFIQISGHGMNGSFRLSAAAKRNPEKFLKNPIRRQRQRKMFTSLMPILKRKSAALLIQPVMHRRTSLTKSSVIQPRKSTGSTKMPRMAQKDVQYSMDLKSEDESNEMPSTSAEALSNMTIWPKKIRQLSHMF